MNSYIYDGFSNVRRYRHSFFEYTLTRDGDGCLVEVADMGGFGVRPSGPIPLGRVDIPIESDLRSIHRKVLALTKKGDG